MPDVRKRDVARLTGWSDKTIYRKVASGELPAWKIGRQLRFRESDVLALLRPVRSAAFGDEPPRAS